MFHIFHFLQSDMVLGIVNLFSWAFSAISSEKSCADFNAFPVYLHWRQNTFSFLGAFLSKVTGRIIRLDELSLVICLERRTSKDSSSS